MARKISMVYKRYDDPLGSRVKGCTIIKAISLDAAIQLVISCPVMKNGSIISGCETTNAMG
jgi:hypothetical protein